MFRRVPSSALIETGDTRVLLGAATPDLAERLPAGPLSAIMLSQFAIDHLQGLLRLRRGIGDTIPVFCPPDADGCADLYQNRGRLEFLHPASFEPVRIGEFIVVPVPIVHTRPTLGYLLREVSGASIAYLGNTALPSNESVSHLHSGKLDALLIDCDHRPRPDPEAGRGNLIRALALVRALEPRQTLLTHVGHDLDAWLLEQPTSLPLPVALPRDGDSIVLETGGSYYAIPDAPAVRRASEIRSSRPERAFFV